MLRLQGWTITRPDSDGDGELEVADGDRHTPPRPTSPSPDLVAEQEQLMELVALLAYVLASTGVGCCVYFETRQMWVAVATAWGPFLALAALPRRPLQ